MALMPIFTISAAVSVLLSFRVVPTSRPVFIQSSNSIFLPLHGNAAPTFQRQHVSRSTAKASAIDVLAVPYRQRGLGSRRKKLVVAENERKVVLVGRVALATNIDVRFVLCCKHTCVASVCFIPVVHSWASDLWQCLKHHAPWTVHSWPPSHAASDS